ncbi:MAG: PDZ domain-containing protein, partial [Myxococcota bacterium]|nr:PDZ domain-containing protein [Myxococcota bacterium]
MLFVKITSALVLSGLLASLHSDKGADPQRLLRLEQLSWSVLELTKNYVDPSRFEPRVMLKESLRAVENLIPDLLVDEAKLPESLTLRIGTKSWTGDTRRVESIWEMYMVLRQGLGFVGRNLPKGVKAAEVELAAVNGMLQTLDPHSVMFSPKAHEEMRMSTQGAFGGLGIVISQRDGWLTVISPIPGTPASRAGVRARDQIVQINEETTENMTLEEAVNLLRGAPGSDVTVHIRRKGTKGSLQKTLTREIIKVRSVTSHDLGEGI